jgi:hypothetical protein
VASVSASACEGRDSASSSAATSLNVSVVMAAL